MPTVTMWRTRTWALCELVLAGGLTCAAAAEPKLFESRQLTPAGEYTFGIEGPAVDAAGTLYVVNHLRQGTVGKLVPGATQSELFAELPAGSVGVSIRWRCSLGRMSPTVWVEAFVWPLA